MGNPSVGKSGKHVDHPKPHTTTKPSGKSDKKPADVAAAGPKPEPVSAEKARAVVGDPVVAPKGTTVLGTSPVASAIPANTKPVETPAAPPASPSPANPTPPAAAPTPPPPTVKPANEHPHVAKVIVSQSGEYDDGIYKGTIRGYMVIPNLDKAIQLLLGADIQNFKKLPKIIGPMTKYDNGVLTYGLKGQRIGFESAGMDLKAFGYRLTMSMTTGANGAVKISWKNNGAQPKTDHTGSDITSFTKNDGYWNLTPVNGYDAVYMVEWHTHTEVDDDTLPTGSFTVPDKVVTSFTNDGAKANFLGAAATVKNLK